MIDIKTATKGELLILFEGLIQLSDNDFDKIEVEDLKRLRREIREELIHRGQED